MPSSNNWLLSTREPKSKIKFSATFYKIWSMKDNFLCYFCKEGYFEEIRDAGVGRAGGNFKMRYGRCPYNHSIQINS